MVTPPTLATNLANLNLYRNADGTVNVTIAFANGAIAELDTAGRLGSCIPHDYVMGLVREAVTPLWQREAYDAFTAMRNDINELAGDMVSQEHNLEPGMGQECETVVTTVRNLKQRYTQACERILDMLKQDDGEAFFQGEAFLKQHAPDLYNRIGLDMTNPANIVRACARDVAALTGFTVDEAAFDALECELSKEVPIGEG